MYLAAIWAVNNCFSCSGRKCFYFGVTFTGPLYTTVFQLAPNSGVGLHTYMQFDDDQFEKFYLLIGAIQFLVASVGAATKAGTIYKHCIWWIGETRERIYGTYAKGCGYAIRNGMRWVRAHIQRFNWIGNTKHAPLNHIVSDELDIFHSLQMRFNSSTIARFICLESIRLVRRLDYAKIWLEVIARRNCFIYVNGN